MKISDQLTLSLHNLMLHKIRSILTSLGIIFGVGSVIAMLSISEGAKEQALASFAALGIDKILVSSKKPPVEGKDTTKAENASRFEAYGLTKRDLDHIQKMENVKNISVARNARQKILKGVTRLDITIAGVSMDFLEQTNSALLEGQGRWFSSTDFSTKRNVCLLGKNARRKLFNLGETNILGTQIKVGGAIYTVLGVFENVHGTLIPGLGSPNDLIVIPMTTSDAIYGSISQSVEPGQSRNEQIDFDTFIVTVKNVDYIDYTSKRITAYLNKSHGADARDWEKTVPYDLLMQKEKTQNIFTIVMGSIAGISLLVGGIGIMNIMLANVYERRKEIGTRRALGAKKTDIIIQFLLETVFLTFVGGTIGVGIGLGIAETVAMYAEWPVSFSFWFIFLALFISAAIGIVFGTYPAWKAAQQNPIDVLRAE